jgi:hypothetical protein
MDGPNFVYLRDVTSEITIDDKLNRTCPGYFRFDTLYGSLQNVNPASTFESSSDDILRMASILMTRKTKKLKSNE